ncbi:hypothetical protein [uncultured Treponema sp.]|uniref:hypothetical protein n=1 Tax=uncultured Treponema sp. TaxID=162155 RepID=UPI00259A5521|nr:hypothetical protein [uncultured Treponema sp.]
MEKPAAEFREFFRRLLILFLTVVTCTELFAKSPSWEYIRSLRFKKAQKYTFTQSDSSFYLDIKDVRPENVQVSVNALPEGVSFISSKKEFLMPSEENGGDFETGTHLVMWFKFSKTGHYRIRPVDVVVNGIYYRIPFETVEVFENPKFIEPELSVRFDTEGIPQNAKRISLAAGTHVVFTVYVKYAVRILDFSWNIPEDSVFTEVVRYNTDAINEKGANEFSTKEYPVATFDWQPLVDGSYSLPQVFVAATAYSGIRFDLALPGIEFKIQPAAPSDKNIPEEKDSAFAYAFAEPPKNTTAVKTDTGSEKNIESLLALYKRERNEFPLFSDAYNQRRHLEVEMGLNPPGRQLNKPLLVILGIAAVLLLAVSVVLLVLRKIPAGAALMCVFVLQAVAFLIYGYGFSKKTALYKGGEFLSIPEENAPRGVPVAAGALVNIRTRAGKWLLVNRGDTFGWVPEDDLFLIQY